MSESALQTAVRRELCLGRATHRQRCSRVLRIGTAVTLLCAVGGGSAAAQSPYQQELLAGFSTLKVAGLSMPEFGDLDSDGDLDLVAGESSGRLRYFANLGSANAPSFVESTRRANPLDALDLGFESDAALVDLDADGDLELVAGSGSNNLRLFKNTGTAGSPAFLEQTGSANPFTGLTTLPLRGHAFADLDGDQDLDLAAQDTFNLIYFENTGTKSAPAFVQRTGTANPFGSVFPGYRASPALVDIDADGDIDAVVGELYGGLRLLRNTGTASAPSFVHEYGSSSPFFGVYLGYDSHPALADLDADGDLDAVVGEEIGTLWHFENTGSATAPAFVARTDGSNPLAFGVDVGEDSVPEFADLDADGDLDAIVGEGLGTLRTFEQTRVDGEVHFLERTGAANPFDGFTAGRNSSPELVDLDRDGDLDAVVGEYYGTLRYLENTGTPAVAAFVERTGSANPVAIVNTFRRSQPALVDLDHDGDLDVAVGASYGVVLYYENTGGSTSPAFVPKTGTANPLRDVSTGFFNSPAFADLDRDGDLDAVVGQGEGPVRYFENVGGPSQAAFVERTGTASPMDGLVPGDYSSPDLADLDADGDLELVLGEKHGRLVFFRSLSVVFADGFESGTTSAWTLTIP